MPRNLPPRPQPRRRRRQPHNLKPRSAATTWRPTMLRTMITTICLCTCAAALAQEPATQPETQPETQRATQRATPIRASSSAPAPSAAGSIPADFANKLYTDVTPSLVGVQFTWEYEFGKYDFVQ